VQVGDLNGQWIRNRHRLFLDVPPAWSSQASAFSGQPELHTTDCPEHQSV
jgi:hypothetical protein